MKYDISVAVTRYNEPNEIVKKCIDSLANQEDVKAEVLFMDQIEDEQIRSHCLAVSNKNIEIKYLRIEKRSLCFARNEGVKLAQARYIAFCDSDCILQPNWLSEILTTFKYTQAAIVGTKIIPLWAGPTKWYHRSKYIQEFYSLLDVSGKIIPFKKIIGASFAFDRQKVGEQAYFEEKYGRANGVLLGGDDTDFSERVQKSGGKIFYTPKTFAKHTVSKERLHWKWISKRAYFGGFSRAMRGGSVDTFNSGFRLIDFLALSLILPSYSLGYFKAKLLNA